MDGKAIRNKLVGTDEQRAVSPVIGVILMVAITVILAAVIAAFVLDLGGSVGEEAQAGVSIDVDEDAAEIQIEVTSLGNADYVQLNPEDDSPSAVDSVDGPADSMEVGDVVEYDMNTGNSGTITAVAVIDEDGTETQVASEDYDL